MQRGIPNYIRVFATMMVFAVHYSVIMLGEKYIKISEILKNGGNGPAMFFVLSGYLTWYSMSNNKYTTKQFLVRRFFRLVPIYYLVLALQMVFRTMPQDNTGLGWLRYFFFINAVIPSNNYYVWNNIDGYWTMSSFVLFYLMTPVLYKKLKNRLDRVILLLIVFFGISQGVDVLLPLSGILENCDNIPAFLAGFPVSNLYFFVIGIAAYCIIQEKKQVKGILICLVGMMGLLVLKKTDYLIWALLTAIVLICGSFSGEQVVIKPCVDKVIYWGGDISYAVYLVHMFILEICQKYLKGTIYYRSIMAVFVVLIGSWFLTKIDMKIFRKAELYFLKISSNEKEKLKGRKKKKYYKIFNVCGRESLYKGAMRYGKKGKNPYGP